MPEDTNGRMTNAEIAAHVDKSIDSAKETLRAELATVNERITGLRNGMIAVLGVGATDVAVRLFAGEESSAEAAVHLLRYLI